MDVGFTYQGSVNGASEASYAYTAKDGSCKTSFTTAIPKGSVSGHKDVKGGTNLFDAVTSVSPVSVAIQADQSSFQCYPGVVLTGSCGTQLPHHRRPGQRMDCAGKSSFQPPHDGDRPRGSNCSSC